MMCFFFFNDTATTEIYTLSLHDALPISSQVVRSAREILDTLEKDTEVVGIDEGQFFDLSLVDVVNTHAPVGDRKSTRLNSSHGYISYAVFCLKKKKKITKSIISSCMTCD